ncbi:MAG: hypothetical protein VYA30_09155 [Myxococcota bacterium]|nr:hypothetical protein [Myxococcota bacterium]
MGILVRIVFICSLMFGCGPRRADPAEQAVQGLVSALYRNDMTTVLRYVTEETRTRLKSQLDGQEALSSQLETRLDWRFERPVHSRARVVDGQTNERKRIVEYEMGGQKRRFPVVREGGGWKVALSQAEVVEPAAKSASDTVK